MTLEKGLAKFFLRFFLIRAAVQVQEILNCEVKLRHRRGHDTDTELVVSAPTEELAAALWQRRDELVAAALDVGLTPRYLWIKRGAESYKPPVDAYDRQLFLE